MKNQENNISIEKEWEDTLKLRDKILSDGWIKPNTIIVNCFPEYSSRLTQTLNHTLSTVNKNALFEQVDLAMPFPSYTQVWNPISKSYEGFDTYIKSWIIENMFSCNFLFVSNIVFPKNLTKIKSSVRGKLDDENFRFCSLYMEQDCGFLPDYYMETYAKDLKPTFAWENLKLK